MEEAISNYAEQQVNLLNKPAVSKCVSVCRNIKCTVDDCPHIVNDDIKCPLSERVDLVCGHCEQHVSMTIGGLCVKCNEEYEKEQTNC